MWKRNPNRQKKVIGRLVSVLLTAVLLTCLTSMCAMASGTDWMPEPEAGRKGALAITMSYMAKDAPSGVATTMPGAEVKLAQVASLSVNGGSADYTLLDMYKSSGIELAGMTASQSNDTAKKLASLAEGGSVRTAVADGNGRAVFDSLEPGMYLVFQDTDANAAYQVEAIAPFLTAVPYPVQSSQGNTWQYSVEARPKTELTGPRNNGVIRVRKQLFNMENGLTFYPPQNREILFYAGLFTDEACTVRAAGTSDLPLRFLNSDTAEAVFENIPTDRTYYIAETDGEGNVVDSTLQGEAVFAAMYPQGQGVSITREDPEREILFYNASVELPAGDYYYGGTLTVTKETKMDGYEYESDDVFYAGIFTDADLTTRYGDVLALKMDESSSVSVSLEVEIGISEDASVLYYVAETDREGNPLRSGEHGFTISMNPPDGKAAFSTASMDHEIIITNNFTENIPTEPAPSPSTVPDPGSVTPGTNQTISSGTDSPKTADETPVMRYVVLMALAFAAILGGVLLEKKHRERRG